MGIAVAAGEAEAAAAATAPIPGSTAGVISAGGVAKAAAVPAGPWFPAHAAGRSSRVPVASNVKKRFSAAVMLMVVRAPGLVSNEVGHRLPLPRHSDR